MRRGGGGGGEGRGFNRRQFPWGRGWPLEVFFPGAANKIGELTQEPITRSGKHGVFTDLFIFRTVLVFQALGV